MMMYVLFDTNVVLDIALKRMPHFDYAAKLFTMIDEGAITGHITASTVTDIYYICKRAIGHEAALAFLSDLIEVVEVIGVDRAVLARALKSTIKDFEDAIQVAAASFNEIDYIVTRNEKDFKGAEIPVASPETFILGH